MCRLTGYNADDEAFPIMDHFSVRNGTRLHPHLHFDLSPLVVRAKNFELCAGAGVHTVVSATFDL